MADATPLPSSATSVGGVAVLLVDDQLLIGEAVRRMLAPEADIRFRFVSDPRKALEVAKEYRPTVILSDLVMPQMDGLELVRQLRADDATTKIPLIVLSSKEEPATKAEAFRLGANDYLVKLPDRVELLARIRYHSQAYVARLERDAAYEALERSRKILADDLEQAARYVRTLLPDELSGPVRARWRFLPCESLGGDAFGYHWIDDDHFAAFLLDVSGHGVGAALLGVSVLNVLRAQSLPATDFRDPGAVLTGLGGAFKFSEQGGKFFTIWYGVYSPSSRILRWSGGGHPPPLLRLDAATAPRWLDSEGPMPGLVPGLAYGTSKVVVPAAARLLVYSDGVYELRQTESHVLGLDEFQSDAASPADNVMEPMTWALSRAQSLRKGDVYDDDVSLLEIEFP